MARKWRNAKEGRKTKKENVEMCIGRAKTKCIRRLIKDNRRHDKRVNKKKR